MGGQYNDDTLKAVEIVKKYCGSTERIRAIFSKGAGKTKIFRQHTKLRDELSQFSNNTIENCFLAIKKEIEKSSMPNVTTYVQQNTKTVEEEESVPPIPLPAKDHRPTTHMKSIQHQEIYGTMNNENPIMQDVTTYAQQNTLREKKTAEEEESVPPIPAAAHAVAFHRNSLFSAYPIYLPPVNGNASDTHLVLLNMIHGCILLASTCGNANEVNEKDKLVETLRLAYNHVDKMKQHIEKQEDE